jgi:integrase
MVSIPKYLSGTGKRVRKFFDSEGKAARFAASCRNAAASGQRSVGLDRQLATMALEASRLLEGSGMSLVEAVKIALRAADGMADMETLLARYKRATDAGEEHWSARYTRDMGKIFSWLGEEAKKRPCADFTQAEIDRLLMAHGAKSPRTLAMRRARVLSVLRYKVRPRRTRNAIAILEAGGVARVLRACAGPEERRVVALLAFAGIRPDAEDGEIARMDWSAVGVREIYVAPEVAKTRTDRHIPITPRLARLLRGYPAAGPVRPPQWARAWKRIRKQAGIADMQDVLRHTFASHFLAAFGEDAAKQAMGHTAGSATLFRFYRRAVTRETGAAYFGIRTG